MSTPQTSSPSKASEPPNPRKRGRTACTRCKTRKQKCDDQLPVCSNCRKSGALCDKVNIAEETIPASYTRALEDQVAFLETKLQQHQDDEAPTNVGERTGAAQNNSSRYALSDIVAHISLGNPEEPAYVGSSSGMSLAMILNEMVQATVWNKSLPDAIGTEEGSLAENLSNSGAKRLEIGDLLAQSVKEPPSDELGTRMIKAYLMQLHPRYPFLDPSDIWKLHENRYVLSAIPPRELCREQRFGVFKLDLIYAIGATLVQLTDKRTSITPEGFYMAALQHISAARESRTIQNIEAMTLLVVYHLRSASSHGMWYMIGLAMRTCIDLGMHRKGNERAVSPGTLDRRRRLFWTVYSLERTIAISLGRPVSISDRLIDVELPASLEDDPSPRGYVQSPTHGSTPTPRVALHLFRLRRIESHIQHSIYRADKPLSSLIRKLDPLYNTLVSWRSSLQADFPLGSPELDYPLLHYHRATRLLIQPFLPLLTLSDAYHGLCLRAAGDICQAHKRLHQTLDYGHSFIAVQTVFVAGVTLV